MNKGRFQIWSSVLLATSLGMAANGCGGGDDDSGGSAATGGSAGKKGAGGKAGASAGGSSGKGGASVSGGSGGAGSGGVSGTGAAGHAGGGAGPGAGAGGSAGLIGAAGTGIGGTVAQGGMAGTAMGGMGGMGGVPSYCYESLYAPLAMENDQADFEIDYGAATPINLSATTLSVRLRAETAGNAGGAQVYVKNGAAQNYAVAYLGWNNLTDLSSFTTLTYDISQATGTTGFDATAIRYVGVNVNAGSTFDGASFQPATVYVDSITFSDSASANLDFNDGVPLLAINQYNSPVAGAAVSAAICQVETGTGGMGGMGGTAGSTSTGGMGGQLGGAGGDEAGAAGLGGEGGLAGADQGTGGSSATGGTAGTGGSGGMSGSSSGGRAGGAGSSGAAGRAGGAGSSGAAGSGGASANLITNGDFESGATTPWTSWGTGTFQISTTAHSGTKSLLVTGRTGSNINIVQTITSVVSAGHTYAVSGWVRTSVASNGHFTAQIDCTTAADTYPWIPIAAVDFSNTGWTQLTGTLDLTNACAGDTINAVNLYLEGPAAGVDVYLDDVTMTLN